MKFDETFNSKQFYRFTGPPEHWLTAVKFMTWGLEQKYLERWKEIQPGDVFFIHSTTGDSSLFKNAESGIIGIGIVGADFAIKDNPLWLFETKNKINKWPLLVPLSEVYLFSSIDDPKTWENPNESNNSQTESLITQLLKNRIPVSSIKGFPPMGSFSAVSNEVVKQILLDKRPLYVITGKIDEEIKSSKPTKLLEVKSATETLRYADSLSMFDEIKTRVVNKENSTFVRNNELLSRAEEVHSSIIESLIGIFKSKGYKTLSNRFVDLFAHNDEKSFLFEVKSTENNNFRSQARKGIVQLFEYDYFEIKKFEEDNNLKFEQKSKILVPSQRPTDVNYVSFINSLEIGLGVVEDGVVNSLGEDFGISRI